MYVLRDGWLDGKATVLFAVGTNAERTLVRERGSGADILFDFVGRGLFLFRAILFRGDC